MKTVAYYQLKYLLASKKKKSHYLEKIRKAKLRNAWFDKLLYERVPGITEPLSIAEQIKFFMMTKEYHKHAFSCYKGVFEGKDVVVCATGPSLRDYVPKQGCIHIGLNNIIQKTDIEFDFLFAQDEMHKNIYDEFISYRGDECKKFVMSNFIRGNLPKCVSVYNAENSFNFDIDILPLPDFTSVVFSAMAFALWTCPKRIYLVGCDCSKGHFGTGKEDTISNEHLVRYWIKLKDFAKEYYPNTEIISINPVGLKGLFREELG